MSKKRKNIHKSRKISVQVTATQPFNGLRLNSATGEVTALMDGVDVDALSKASVSVSYDRPKGPKVIAELDQGSGIPYMTPYAFVEQFDVIFAIDTNTRLIDGISRSVGATSVLEKQSAERHENGAISKVTFHENMFMIFEVAMHGSSPGSNPETHSWRLFIEEGVKKYYKKYSDNLRIGLVVDSELANLHQYNQRLLPLCGDYFLPSNFILLYASADTGADLPLNKLLMYCDKEATLQLDAMQRGEKMGAILIKREGDRQIAVPGTPYRL